MLNVLEIRDQAVRYLQNQMTLADLNDWLTQRSWNMHLDSPLDAQRLAADAELLLAEYSLGHRSSERLQDALCHLVRSFWPVAAGV
jgi:hypothetical protein